MVITRISKRKNNRLLYAVFVDDEFSFDISETTLVKYGLRTKDAIDEDKLAAVKAAEAEHQARTIAVNYLSYRPRSSREVFQHLLRKKISEEVAGRIVSHFESVHLINNLEFARMFVRDKLLRKPTGVALLRKHLSIKGIPTEMIDQVVHEYISDDDQRRAARDLAATRLRLTKRSMARLEPAKQRQRLTGYLLRHGFSSEIVQKTIQNLFRA